MTQPVYKAYIIAKFRIRCKVGELIFVLCIFYFSHKEFLCYIVQWLQKVEPASFNLSSDLLLSSSFTKNALCVYTIGKFNL